MTDALRRQWARVRSRALVVACSDGRLQEATDAFLADELGLTEYNRFYMPGGGGALAASGPDATCADYRRKLSGASAAVIRARQVRDASELLERRDEWAGPAAVSVYWCEVDPTLQITFRAMELG